MSYLAYPPEDSTNKLEHCVDMNKKIRQQQWRRKKSQNRKRKCANTKKDRP